MPFELFSILFRVKNVQRTLLSLPAEGDLPFLSHLLLSVSNHCKTNQWAHKKLQTLLSLPAIIDTMNAQNIRVHQDPRIRLKHYPPLMAYLNDSTEMFNIYCQYPNVIHHILKALLSFQNDNPLIAKQHVEVISSIVNKSLSWFMNLFLCMHRASIQKRKPNPALPREMELALAKQIMPLDILFQKPEKRVQSIQNMVAPWI